ncbi:hypothetical protein [Bacteroides salyersiae]|nr:hypothetical protein [Bacteroides salyersiae]
MKMVKSLTEKELREIFGGVTVKVTYEKINGILTRVFTFSCEVVS